MSFNFQDVVPQASQWLQAIAQTSVVRHVNETIWIFAIIETAHLLLLAVLGGGVLILNLRLLDLVLGDVPTKDVERATRPWLYVGIIGTMATGLVMAIATATTLMTSAAFFLKMIALVAAILLSILAAREVRRDGGVRSGISKFLAVIALLLWSFSVLLFATTTGIGSGALVIALFGFALFAAFIGAGRHRRAYMASLAVILLGGFLITQRSPVAGGHAPLADWVNFAPIAGALIVAGIFGVLEVRAGAGKAPTPAKLTAFASTLAWVTVAAAGRWIGFS